MDTIKSKNVILKIIVNIFKSFKIKKFFKRSKVILNASDQLFNNIKEDSNKPKSKTNCPGKII